MSYFPIHRFRHYDDPLDHFFGDQLDFFDPWGDSDYLPAALVAATNPFRWISEPPRLTHSHPRHRAPHKEKFRVQLNVAGFNPDTIKTKVEGRKVIVEAKQEDRTPDGDYNIRQLRKSYDLPEHAEAEHMTSYVTPNKMLVIEVPIKNPEVERQLEQAKKDEQSLVQFGEHRDPLFDYSGFLGGSDFQSRIIDKPNNEKQLEMTLGMKNFRPQEIKVSVKNNELIVQGEHRHQDPNRSERSFFFRSAALPPGTQVDHLQTHLTDDGHLKIEAPYVPPKETSKAVEHKKEEHKMEDGKKEEHKMEDGKKEEHKEGQKKEESH